MSHLYLWEITLPNVIQIVIRLISLALLAVLCWKSVSPLSMGPA